MIVPKRLILYHVNTRANKMVFNGDFPPAVEHTMLINVMYIKSCQILKNSVWREEQLKQIEAFYCVKTYRQGHLTRKRLLDFVGRKENFKTVSILTRPYNKSIFVFKWKSIVCK